LADHRMYGPPPWQVGLNSDANHMDEIQTAVSVGGD